MSERIDASIAFTFEPRLSNLGQNDERLAAYGFQPVGSPVVPIYGIRALFWTENGWRLGGSVTYGFRLSEAGESAVPTTTSWVTTTYVVGRVVGAGFAVDGNVGFASLTHTVGSRRQGGSLVYLGPVVQPRLSWRIPVEGPHFEFSAGYLIQVPVGDAHDNPLWEAPFERPFVHALTVGIDMGARF